MILAGDVKDFWCPKHNPSFNEEENRIYFEMGSTPATISKTFYEWDKLAKNFMPKCKSRLGTKDEYVVFLGFIIKSLVEDTDAVSVKEFPTEEENVILIQVIVSEKDMGRVIGKSGRTANAIRTLIQASSSLKDNKYVKIDIDKF